MHVSEMLTRKSIMRRTAGLQCCGGGCASGGVAELCTREAEDGSEKMRAKGAAIWIFCGVLLTLQTGLAARP